MELNLTEYKERRREIFDLVDRAGRLSDKLRLHSLSLTVFESMMNGDVPELPADADLHGFLLILHSYLDQVEEETRALFGDLFDSTHALMRQIAPPDYKSIQEQAEEAENAHRIGGGPI